MQKPSEEKRFAPRQRTGARHSNHILTASESHFKMPESMGLPDIPCQPCVREGEGMLAGSAGGEAT